MVIKQGDIYWIDLGEPIGSEPAYIRPYVVIQNDLLNSSQIRTVIVCALTSNLRRAKAMGNVLLELGEANLDRQSVVNVSQIFTVDKALWFFRTCYAKYEFIYPTTHINKGFYCF
jgi:mRNA interferase MazF